MALEINVDAQCGECGGRLDDGDEIFCEGCKEELDTKIEELEERVQELEETLEACKINCETCENRYDCLVNKEKKE